MNSIPSSFGFCLGQSHHGDLWIRENSEQLKAVIHDLFFALFSPQEDRGIRGALFSLVRLRCGPPRGDRTRHPPQRCGAGRSPGTGCRRCDRRKRLRFRFLSRLSPPELGRLPRAWRISRENHGFGFALVIEEHLLVAGGIEDGLLFRVVPVTTVKLGRDSMAARRGVGHVPGRKPVSSWSAALDDGHFLAESLQIAGHFESDGAASEHGDAVRQFIRFENVVARPSIRSPRGPGTGNFADSGNRSRYRRDRNVITTGSDPSGGVTSRLWDSTKWAVPR